MKAGKGKPFSVHVGLLAVHGYVLAATAGPQCSLESMRGKCECEHHSMRWGFQCSGCLDKHYWGYGCDLECPMDECPQGCDFIGNCIVPSRSNCKHSTRVENPTHDSEELNLFGECQACNDGWFGTQCEQSCMPDAGIHCKRSESEGTCTRGGNCYACQAGWYGKNCSFPCPPGCPQDCVPFDFAEVLDKKPNFRPAGSCRNDCTGDYYGQNCEHQCPAACKKYSGKASCEKDTGDCIKCQDKWTWGPKCENKCSVGCDKGCVKETGHCKDGKCKAKYWWLPDCSLECSPYCASGSCFGNNGYCKGDCGHIVSDLVGGKCQGICKHGWWLKDCSAACPNRTVGACKQLDGMPEHCSKGYYPGRVDTQPLGIYKVLGLAIDIGLGHAWIDHMHQIGLSTGSIPVFQRTEAYAPPDWDQTGELLGASRIRVVSVDYIQGAANKDWIAMDYDRLVDGTGPLFGTVAVPADRTSQEWEYEESAACILCPENCIDGECDQHGTCTKGCVPGTYGRQCTKACPAHCTPEGCDRKHAGARRDGYCANCQDGYTGTTCKKKCHSTCVTCLQGVTALGAQKPDQCLSCPKQYPNVDIKKYGVIVDKNTIKQMAVEGRCDCLSSAYRDETDGFCKCKEPEDDPKRQAHFELYPEKSCRWICKRSGPIPYVEVLGDHKSDCIRAAKQRIVHSYHFVGKGCEEGCGKDECHFDCGESGKACNEKEQEQGYFCLHEEYSEYIRGNLVDDDAPDSEGGA